MNRLLFKRPPPLTPGQVDDIGRAVRDLFNRLRPQPVRPLPVPVIPPQQDLDNPPQTEEQPDTRTDECVYGCDENDRCPTKTFCFNKMRFIGTPKEAVYDTQLAVQEATMRTMSPGQFLGNRATYEAMGRSALEQMPGVSDARDRVIMNWQQNNPGQDWRAQGLEALHRLDMGAGGAPTGYYAMGDKNVNRSIGGSWPSKMDSLKQHAQNLQANGCPLMTVRFDSSPSCVADPIPSTGYPE